MKNISAFQHQSANKGVFFLVNPGVPGATVGAGVAGTGSLCSDTVNAKLYINTGTLAAPVWTVVGTQT